MKRWKEGISQVSQTQQVKASFYGHFFVVVGILLGLYITIKTKVYWLSLILFGSLILEVITIFGSIQKFLIFKTQDILMQSFNSQLQDSSSPEEEKRESISNTTFQPATDILKAEKVEKEVDKKEDGNSIL